MQEEGRERVRGWQQSEGNVGAPFDLRRLSRLQSMSQWKQSLPASPDTGSGLELEGRQGEPPCRVESRRGQFSVH